MEDSIHIHCQQLYDKRVKPKTYYLALTTKNEKGISEDGRLFPLTESIRNILDEIRMLQGEMEMSSEFIFCKVDGTWINEDGYMNFLKRICRSFGFKVTNNHAFRMSLNSNVMIPLGIPVTNRARLLGHSVETNLKYYSYEEKDYLEDSRNRLNAAFVTPKPSGGHLGDT